MLVNIPVSQFSYQVLLSLYQKEPFVIKASDELANVLCYNKAGDDNKLDKVLSTLTLTASFDVSNTVAKSLNKRAWRVGLAIDDYLRNDLNKYTFALAPDGQGATVAIQKWCTLHGIEIDHHINFDTLYKSWQRYFAEKTAFFRRQKQNFVRKNREKKQQKIQFTDSELDAIIAAYQSENPTYFLTQKGRTRKKLSFQLRMYVYRVVGSRTPQYIAKKFKLNIIRKKRNKHTVIEYDARIRYSVRAFAIFLKSAPAIVLP